MKNENMGSNISEPSRPMAIAIIGMAGRFPDAATLDDFWKNLAEGRESLREFSDEEMRAAGVPEAALGDPNYVRRGTVLDDAESFDAEFFGFNPREAEITDPQQRIFLECSWEALEDAGYGSEHRPESIGVFAGASINSYLFNNILSNAAALESVTPYQLMLASDKDFLATRVSYKLNLKGPSLTVQTACSTSLVAVNLACEQLINRHCDMALAGGVSLSFPAKAGYLYTEGMILSPDGRCRPFDAKAGGTRAGAGAGVVVLKRLDDAVRDRDSIRAVILGHATNNDGGEKIGYTAPSVDGQASAITTAQQMAGVHPDTISYIETHGTATHLGDPIEIAALEKAFRQTTQQKQYCAIGSLKSNLGHLDAAAGVAGLIKTVLCLEQKAIAPSLHYKDPNPRIDFENSPFFVNNRLRPWAANGTPRRAGVSSFGIGGTNAHLILEEGPVLTGFTTNQQSQQLVTLSARSAESLDKASERLADWLAAHPDLNLADVCYTLQLGRKRFSHRRVMVVKSREHAIDALQQRTARGVYSGASDSTERPVAFLFSGQGSQHVNMAGGLYRQEKVFREEMDQCAELLKPRLGLDIRGLLFESTQEEAQSDGNESSSQLNQTWLAQPLLFSVEYSLARQWMHWGIQPNSMIGHSIGEYVAACLAGVFSLEDALALVSERGRLMQQAQPGAMLAVSLSAERLKALCGMAVEIAAVNTPNLCTVSGTHGAIDDLEKQMEAQGVRCRRLHTSHAFHSSTMDSVHDEFLRSLERFTLRPPQIRFISNLTGHWITAQQAMDPTYWAMHLRHTVRFAEGLGELVRDNAPILLEVGPGEVLSTFARQCGHADVFTSLPHPQSLEPDTERILTTLGRLWIAGAAVDWSRFHQGQELQRVSLPTYAFERQRFVVEPRPASSILSAFPVLKKKSDIADYFYVPGWKRTPAVSDLEPTALPAARDWLVFANGSALSSGVVQALRDDGHRMCTVVSGAEYSSTRDSYVIRAGEPKDYAQMFRDIADRGWNPEAILHLWNVTEGKTPDDAEETGFYSMLAFAKACSDAQGGGRKHLIVVTDGVHVVDGEEVVCPEKATLLGPVKVIPKEFPFLQVSAIDVDAHMNEAGRRRAVRELLLEASADRNQQIMAYRGHSRWEQCFEPLRLGAGNGAIPLRQRGVYLITGGLGGIGLVFAKSLAQSAQARLVLTSRSAFPERPEWGQWVSTHPATDATSQKIELLLEIERAGGEVLVVKADAADEIAMTEAVQLARRHFGSIQGAIHAAGLPGGGLIELKSREAVAEVMAPKVKGTRILESLLVDDQPDFLILCSSIDAILGGVGSSDYCAANLFLDAFAASRTSLPKTKVVSINWTTWQSVGMAFNAVVPERLKQARTEVLKHALGNDEAVEALRRVLNTGLSQVAVVTTDLAASLELVSKSQERSAETPEQIEEVDPGMTSEEWSSASRILRIWQELLGTRNIELDSNFFELGGHSLLGTSVLSRIRQQFGVSLPLRTLFEAPTVSGLADRVDTLRWATGEKKSDAENDREEIEL